MNKAQFARRCRNWLAGGTLVCGLVAVLVLNTVASMNAQDAPAAGFAVTAFDTPTYSSPIAMSADKNHIWVVNPDDDSVSVIGNLGGTPSVIKNITNVGDEPQSIALDVGAAPGQYRAYVANAADNSVTVINVTASNASSITAAVQKTLITGAEPYNIVASPDGKRIFVANSVQDTISVIDTSTQNVIGAVDLRNSACNDPDRNRHFQPRGLAVTLNNDRLYVTRFLSFTGGANAKQGTDDGKVGVVCQLNINTASTAIADYTPATRVEIGAQDSGFKVPGNANTTSAYPNQMQSIVIRGEQAYLPNIASSPLGPLRFNVDTHAFVNVLDNVATGTPADASGAKFKNLHLGARIPETGKTKLFFANPWAIAFTNQSGAGNGYVVSAGSDLLVKVTVDAAGKLDFTGGISTTRYIDLNDSLNPATQGEKAGKNPLGIVIRDTRAFVMNYISRNVSVVNLSSDTVESVLKLTNLPSPASEEEQLQVGAEIFFSSRGVFEGGKVNRLSSEGWQNCASCHFAGLTDGNIWQFGSGPRKSVPLNGTWSPHNPDDQRVLNYSAIFDEVQDFELNIRNVSGPGPLSAGPPAVLDPNHGLIISDTGNIDAAPKVVAPFLPIANANRQQVTVRLPGSSTSWPALDAMKEWVRFAIRTPNGALTSDEVAGGLNANTVGQGRRLFFQAGCQKCHGGTKWTISNKDFTSPPAAADVVTETDLNGVGTPPDPNAGQFLPKFLFDIKSFNLNVAGANPLNQVPGAALIGAVEKDTAGKDGLGIDYNNDGKGAGFNIPSLLAIWHVPPYYHNGACETLDCVLANPNHRASGLRPGQSDPLTDPNKQKAVVEWLKTLDADTPFPLNVSVRSHDIFIDPPVVYKGQTVTVGANVSLFGTRADLKNLLEDQSLTSLTVRFELDPSDSAATVDVEIPTANIDTLFKQDFGQAVISTTWSIPANPSGNFGTVTVTVDPEDELSEANEDDNDADRRVRLRNAPSDNTSPTVNAVYISDDNPFNDNDAITAVRDVKVKIQASDPTGNNNATPSGVAKYCIVRYTYDVVNRRWIESACSFAVLPAPEAGTTDTFIVSTQLQAREGVAYAFVWIKDKAGNISRRPGFDVISFIPSSVIQINRNDVRIFRIPLTAGQSLKLDFAIQSGDVDVSVFDDFKDPNATRIAVSANNGTAPESVTLTGPGDFQVEVDAIVNSRFTVATTTAVEAVAASSASPSVIAVGDDTPIIAGPPAARAAIEDEDTGDGTTQIYLPIVTK